MRAVDLPHGARIILSDTVGFISDLPTMLVAAFRATLEEVIEADVILHVRDVSHEDTEAQSHDVDDVLRQLGIEPEQGRAHDRGLEQDRPARCSRARRGCDNLAERQPAERRPVLVSALTGEGTRRACSPRSRRGSRVSRVELDLVLDPADGAGVSWLHRHTEVMAKALRDDGRLGDDGARRSGQCGAGARQVRPAPRALSHASHARRREGQTSMRNGNQ